MKKRPPNRSQHPQGAPDAGSASLTIRLVFIGVIVVFIGLIVWGLWPRDKYTKVPAIAAPPKKVEAFVMQAEKAVFAQYAGSESCRQCHATEHAKWTPSHHSLAERAPQDALDLAAFDPPRTFAHGSQTTEVRKKETKYEFVTLGFNNQRASYPVERVIGHDPLRQYLVDGGNGRLHALEACFDPHKNEWFDVYGNEDRKPGEWGHWTGRGMVWNQMCASCHNTRVRKNYEAATDSYHTTMAQMTVSCESCHGPMKAHDDWQRQYPGQPGNDPHVTKLNRDQHMENCAGCHARRGEITGDAVPGESFWDHYLLSIVDHSDTFYPDGQIRDENYEFTSFMSSRMQHAGVRCMDCHDSHSMKTILPGNQLCMRCHTPGGFPNAPVILPEAHSFHKAESTGNQCINCHMPQTTYMQRHDRHDHGFTIPDPLLTKQFAIPNACNKCHQDKTVEWTLDATQKWWGPKMERKTRQRATLMAQARQGNMAARDGLVALLGSDEIPYWKASTSLLLDQWLDQPAVQQAVTAQLKHEHPLVRQSAARSLEPLLQNPAARPSLTPLLNDPFRNVHVTAAWALRDSLDLESIAGKDLLHMLNLNADQPSGQMQLGQFYFARRDLPTAIKHMETAIAWDPNSPPFHHDLAMLYNAAGDSIRAMQKLRDTIKIAPNEAQYHYELGLAASETGDMNQTIASLRETVRLDPRFARAWYNLGLALNGQSHTAEALDALLKGEAADPTDAGIPYARATILAQMGRKTEALAATQKALSVRPDFTEARQLLMMLSRP
ncbi:MAG: tetratricopeptide repeat protein [Prosthecobacter sp.]|nr:tetratricopeptide repeat protein [Prosthecobacter sp.]